MRRLLYTPVLALFLAACASIGSPDGGPYDETPPKVIGSTPANKAINAQEKRIRIQFDEYIKLENASDKVVVSPPQKEAPNIRADGKHVRIDLFDTLQENTTYTIDFSDAIVDNNEGNPMGNYCYSFSTGPDIDTMEVSGYVLNAENLEPIKGILVGLYNDGPDSLFTTQALQRVARTNGSGRFNIKGVKNHQTYRAFALQDMDGNFMFSQKSEMVAFDTLRFQASKRPDIRLDTVWRDSTHYDSIRAVPYTRYLPDDLVLLAFLEEGQDLHLLKTERNVPERFTIFFTAPVDTLPRIKGLNFKDDGGFIVEPSLHGDTINYWIPDTTIAYQDTLTFSLTYLDTDTLGQQVWKTDTLELLPKTTRAKQLKELAEKTKEWEKEQKKKEKKMKNYHRGENPHLTTFITASCKPSGGIAPNQNPLLTFSEPITGMPDSNAVHFTMKVDTLWLPAPYELRRPDGDLRSLQLYAEWDFGHQYKLEIDSAAIVSVLGHHNQPIKQSFSVKKEEEFGTLFIQTIPADSNAYIQLLNGDKTAYTVRADADGRASFYFLKPGSYYMRCFIDSNGNGQWTTGEFKSGTRPEEVFYFPNELTIKAQWDVEQEWNMRSIPTMKQKPLRITKQKADKEKKIRNRNQERSASMQRASQKRQNRTQEQ